MTPNLQILDFTKTRLLVEGPSMYRQRHPEEDGLTFERGGRKYVQLNKLKDVMAKDKQDTQGKDKGKKS